MTQRVIDLFEPVKVHHHHRAIALGRAKGAQHSIDRLRHLVAIGETSERVIFGKPLGLFFAVMRFSDIAGITAKSAELARTRPDSAAGKRNDRVAAARRSLHIESRKWLACAQFESNRRRTADVFARREHFLQGPPDIVSAFKTKLLRESIAEIDDLSIRVGRPEPTQAGFFQFGEHCQLLFVAHARLRSLAAAACGIGQEAFQWQINTPANVRRTFFPASHLD